ncbi:protein MAIN-LIKE 2-like [Vicia villosa]|uniref:protein MAIN-LIKE 2-like n=1 Tax=Vicia villosa TaxID=3911 RepID=UPI00273B3013|nr:protein MAIN-LIKE 2-like [Vicia villosa]
MSLLTLGEEHRGTPNNIMAYDINKFRPRSHSFVEVDDMIRPYLQQARFGHVINITSYGVDRKFLLALCERWLPETHTFHLPTGECTITLEDVHMLMGLRINGFAVAGSTSVSYSIAEELLGEPLTNTSRKGQFIKMTWLKEKYENQMTLTDASTIEEILQKARVYILLLFGGLLFPDTNGNTIHLQYLPLLSDFNKTGQYSWGSATLAHLWSAHGMNYEKTPHHCAPGYRTFIDHFEPIDFTWRPYLELEDLEPTDSGVWSSKTFIISFTYVEMHHSDRVKLQFGIKQGIPDPPTCMEEYHKSQLSDQWPYDDWKDHYKNERRQWHNRHKTVLQGEIMPQECKPSPDYMSWYATVSNLYLSPNRYLFDPRSQPSTSNFQQSRPPIPNMQQHFQNTQQNFNPTQPPFTPSQQYHHQNPYTSYT